MNELLAALGSLVASLASVQSAPLLDTANDMPRDVRAQLFSGDRASSSQLDRNRTLCWN